MAEKDSFGIEQGIVNMTSNVLYALRMLLIIQVIRRT